MTIANLNRQTIATLPAGAGEYRDRVLKGFVLRRRLAASLAGERSHAGMVIAVSLPYR